MKDIFSSSHILMHIFLYLKLFLAIFGYPTISYFRLFYCRPLLAILHYFTIGYSWQLFAILP
jgi:hypothetical protein